MKLTQSQPGPGESLHLTCPVPRRVQLPLIRPGALFQLMDLLQMDVHPDSAGATEGALQPAFVQPFTILSIGEASGWHSWMCWLRFTPSAVQFPIGHFLLGLFCKIDNRQIMPHQYTNSDV